MIASAGLWTGAGHAMSHICMILNAMFPTRNPSSASCVLCRPASGHCLPGRVRTYRGAKLCMCIPAGSIKVAFEFFANQAGIGIPEWIPTPGQQQYIQAVHRHLRVLPVAVQGGVPLLTLQDAVVGGRLAAQPSIRTWSHRHRWASIAPIASELLAARIQFHGLQQP